MNFIYLFIIIIIIIIIILVECILGLAILKLNCGIAIFVVSYGGKVFSFMIL